MILLGWCSQKSVVSGWLRGRGWEAPTPGRGPKRVCGMGIVWLVPPLIAVDFQVRAFESFSKRLNPREVNSFAVSGLMRFNPLRRKKMML